MKIDLRTKVLDKTDGGLDIIYSLYPDARSVVEGTAKKFKMRPEERTASATIRKKNDGIWYICDFGDDGHEINALDAYMKYHNIAYFSEAIHQLADMYGVDDTLQQDINKATQIEFDDVEGTEAKEGDFTYVPKSKPSEADLRVWGAFVKEETLKRYHYYSLESYTKVFRKKDTGRLTRKTVHSSEDFPIFLHECGEFRKIYCPLSYDKAFRFFYDGSKPKDYVNGLEEAIAAYDEKNGEDKVAEGKKEKLPAVFLCSGERDAMNVAGLGYYPIWLNSETADLTYETLSELRRIAKRIYNIPDIDATGVRQGERLALQHVDIYTVELPKWLLHFKDNRGKPRKDLRDFLDLRPSKYEFEKLVNTAMQAQFWQETVTDKEGVERKKIEIKATNLLYYLRLNGFYKLKDPITGEVKPCRLNEYKVESMEPKQLRDFVREDLKARQVSPNIMEAYINSKRATQSIYDDLDNIEVSFDVSTPTTRTLFFDNCSIVVSADGLKITNSKDVSTYCWANKVIPHKFTELPPAFHIDANNEFHIDSLRSKVFRYLINGSRLNWKAEMETDDPEADAKYAAENKFNIYGPRLTEEQMQEHHLNLLNKLYTYGYLLHHFKQDDMAKCVWIMESKLTNEDESSGGSGKSLFMRVLHYMKLADIVTLDGRDGDMTKNNHFLDRVSSNTDILFIDDAAKNFPFDTFYGKITGQLTVNPKGSQSFEIDYRDSPYTVISSNFPWKGDDRSTLRRLIPVVFGDYYHEQGSDGQYKETRMVSSDFDGQNLFGHEHTDEDWNADYNFMVNCLQFYLKNKTTVFMPPLEKVMQRVRNAMMGDTFKAWADIYFAQDDEHPNERLDHVLIKQWVYDDYCSELGKTGKSKSSQSFKVALKIYCKEKGWVFCPPTMIGWSEKEQRSTKNLLIGAGKRKSTELIYIQTDPKKAIDNTLPDNIY